MRQCVCVSGARGDIPEEPGRCPAFERQYSCTHADEETSRKVRTHIYDFFI